MTGSFTQVFGGNTIYPSDVSYLALALDADTVLEWPSDSNSADVAARIIDVTPSGTYDITLSSALSVGVGTTILFNNLGPDAVTVKSASGATLLSITAGDLWQIYLTDNDTVGGVWRTFRYGASTAQAQASALAGYGLTPTGSTLSQQYPVTEINTNYTIGAPNRAATLVWTGGVGTFTLPTTAAAVVGWFVNVRNAGSGTLTLSPAGGEIINGGSSLVLQPGDSAIVVANVGEWYTIGLGQQAVFAFDYTSIDLTGETSPYTLSGAELNRIAYKFVGTLTADMEIVVPGTIQQYWVDNATTGVYDLGLRTPSQVTPVNVPQGSRGILYANGSNVVAADTRTLATPFAVSDGGTGSTTAGGALVNLGGTAIGIDIFTAATQAAAWTALGVAPAGTVNGGTF